MYSREKKKKKTMHNRMTIFKRKNTETILKSYLIFVVIKAFKTHIRTQKKKTVVSVFSPAKNLHVITEKQSFPNNNISKLILLFKTHVNTY